MDYKIIKLTCGDIVVGLVTNNGKRMLKEPWQLINLNTILEPKFVLAPYETFVYGEHKQVTNLELKYDQIVYEKDLESIPHLKDQYFERAMAKSGIVT